ncbi:hypothetical protein J1N35_037123 [Gossypium stocksii]|uniref:Uncharacterized protein n=1 Tax=Gossypium stocksii TaxID=47602 RepID=A0A9D3ZLE1_9ROSI|nr:hypothetical protein J1N35_037123 [Gossypium stocksii]
MALIRLDARHIFDFQLQMIEDQIIEMYMHNLSTRALHVIEQHLQETGYPALINTLVER